MEMTKKFIFIDLKIKKDLNELTVNANIANEKLAKYRKLICRYSAFIGESLNSVSNKLVETCRKIN